MTGSPPRIFCITCECSLDQLRCPRCPKCGRAFDPDDPSTFRVRLTDPIVICRARNHMQAHFLRDLLIGEGILTEVREDAPFLAYGGPCTIRVAAEDLELARLVLEGATAASDGDAEREVWICPACGEDVEGQFQMCWHCQEPRAGSPDG